MSNQSECKQPRYKQPKRSRRYFHRLPIDNGKESEEKINRLKSLIAKIELEIEAKKSEIATNNMLALQLSSNQSNNY